ncbi:DUF3526 domain-containing protein [Mucilaginibacter gilvus]|uniref:DUF3526 domain-containing protein n=1 Tax=Mucilaginibacter gilvus TaxID=2305909 RepID=A0A3S3YQV2_9SPHI|nr:DUF3526 domain-containing protein [Mucilaginibacter gilvus]RWY48313.1 DUF3526 domain-containing protein [Mucilaginibacter gilvus]
MNAIWLLTRHQFTEWRRSKLLYVFVFTFACLWIFCLYTGLLAYRSVAAMRENAGRESRGQWLNQDRKHPHIAAHFGNFAFKQVNPLSIFDNGTDAYTGTYVYMEAHRQNDVLFSPAQSTSSLVRFGSFNIALLLQVFVPLFLIVLTFNTIISERISGTLALLKSSGISSRQLAVGKVFAPWLLVAMVVALFYMLSAIVLVVERVDFVSQDVLKTAAIFCFYLAYYFVVTVLGVYVSTVAGSVKQSLIVLLSGWVFACILVPKLVANVATGLYPLPSNTEFKTVVMKDIVNGIDGHNTSDKRALALTKQMLKKYKVDSTSKLPINIEGIIMMEGEKYSSKVYNDHFDQLSRVLLKQQKVFAFTSLLDPLLGIKNLSMGLSNTDYFNDRAFRLDAESYRMNFVQTMNRDMALHSKEDGFTTYKIGRELFNSIPQFSYRSLNAAQSLKNYVPEIMSLLLLTVLSGLMVKRIAYKL